MCVCVCARVSALLRLGAASAEAGAQPAAATVASAEGVATCTFQVNN